MKNEQAIGPTALLTEALIGVARAAHSLADNTEGEDNVLRVDPGDFANLSAALDTLDALPEPMGEVATGPRKAVYWINLIEPNQLNSVNQNQIMNQDELDLLKRVRADYVAMARDLHGLKRSVYPFDLAKLPLVAQMDQLLGKKQAKSEDRKH
jgi:hypothetical protein